ncbi:MAG: hypothetical protein HN837_05465, partial [Chloroflexi bacterium]|nr:hypothetical protein [Chloroflexota bacterium]
GGGYTPEDIGKHAPQIAYVSWQNNDTVVCVMNIDGSNKTLLTGELQMSRYNRPTWSPDGNKLAYGTYEGIWVINTNGTGQTNITDELEYAEQFSWSPVEQKIVFVSHLPDEYREIYTVNADGTGLTRLTNGSTSADNPIWSPNGEKITYRKDQSIYVMDADGSNQTRLNYYPYSGSIWSPDSSQIACYLTGAIYIINADGSGTTNLTGHFPPATEPGSIWENRDPVWSPDGTKIAFESSVTEGDQQPNEDIYVINADGTNPVRITNNPAFDGYPTWSPDGNKILFVSNRDGYDGIYLMDADGSNQTSLAKGYNPVWSADSSKIIFEANDRGYQSIYVINTDGTDLTKLANGAASPAWSPQSD